MQNGTYVASSVPFGFRRINGNLVIEEAEARYVRLAFSNYLAGKSTSDIAKEFTAQSAACLLYTSDPALFLPMQDVILDNLLPMQQWAEQMKKALHDLSLIHI